MFTTGERRKHIEGSKVWDSDIKEVAMARLQQNMESCEQQEEELLPSEAQMWQIGSNMQSSREKHRAFEGQIKKLRSGDNPLQRNHPGNEKVGNAQKSEDIVKRAAGRPGRNHAS